MANKQLLACVLCASALSSIALADAWNKKTKVTFSGPVEVPGVVLPAGTYIFKLVNSDSNRHVIQVQNVAGSKTYATVLAIADYRINASSKTLMYFGERASGSPPAIKSWFYPGDNFGHRFVYPKVKAQEIAAQVSQPVPSTEVKVIETTKYVAVPVYIQTPAKEEAAYDAKQFDKTDATDTAGVDGEAVKEAPAPTPAPAPEKKLPKTSSPIHLIGLLGGLAMAGGVAARQLARRLR